MYHIASRKVVETATWSEDEWEKTFFLSYVWAQWTDDALAEKLAQLSRPLNSQYCWVDRWCIDQTSPEDKEKQLSRMGDYYEGAQLVVVLIPEITERWRGLIEVRGQLIHAEAMISVNLNFLIQYKKSQWLERMWTFQEGYMARNILLATQIQLLDMLVVNTLYMCSETRGFTTLGCLTNDAVNHFITHVDQPTGIVAANKRLINGGQPPTKDSDLTTMLLSTARRACTVEQDRLHAVAAVIGDRSMEVDYHTPLVGRLRTLARRGDLDSRILFGNSVSTTPNESWLPAFGGPRLNEVTLSGVDACRIKPLSNGRVEVQARRVTGKCDGDMFSTTSHETWRKCRIHPRMQDDGVTEKDTLLIIKESEENGEGLLVAGTASG
ncbi:hypothetical protein F5Y12DRAFT_800147 [Xylaria sp. FL1777]|nr:hypothetical protein F5Y12DRAFT_800147 [Xylaria sp. FL1777]